MSKIEWTEKTLSCITGCTKISSGCIHCYGESMTRRLQGADKKKIADGEEPGKFEFYKDGFDVVKLHAAAWQDVTKWTEPTRVFLNPMSDTFHKDVPSWYIEHMFECMNRLSQHTWQVLTKRSGRMEDLCNHRGLRIKVTPNIWMGVSVESQEYINRIKHLAKIKAKVKFVSFEPLLGPIDLSDIREEQGWWDTTDTVKEGGGFVLTGPPALPFHWAIVGAESGAGARPMEEQWVRDLIRQLKLCGVKVFYKQKMAGRKKVSCPEIDGRQWMEYPGVRSPTARKAGE